MTDLLASALKNSLGLQVLQWAVSQSDIWHLAHRCSELAQKINEPLENSAYVLDNLLTMDEDDINCIGIRDLHLQQMHFDDEEEHTYGCNETGYYRNQQHTNSSFSIRKNLSTDNTTESLNNGHLLLSPPHNNSHVQRENIQVTQPSSIPSSPLTSPGAQSSSSFTMPNTIFTIDTGDPNWQATKPTVRERNAAMFNNELMSDISFIVGSDDNIQTIHSHKYVLATGSSVFYAMFYGGLAENKKEIKVPDVEPSAFLTLLKYLYCDEIYLEADNVLATLYAAKKYIVPHLARACVNYLETSLTAKNACLLLSQSRLFEEPELMQRCWEVIDAQAEMAIKSEGFVDIDMKTFESILSRETLNCREIHLFEAAQTWAQSACTKMDIDPSPQNRRNVLGSSLKMIRIPTMTLEEFANGVAQTGILTPQETIDIFLSFTAKKKPNLDYSIKPRAGLKTQVCHRFQSCAYRSNQWRYRGRCDSIQFSVDKRIFIVGFGLYGSSTGAAEYNVKIDLKRLGCILAENNTKFFSDGSSNTFHVFFENPIQCEADSWYTASVILDGSELSFFGQEGMTEVCTGNVTFQFQCSSDSTNGTGVQGGQIPELIFYGPTMTCTSDTNITNITPSLTKNASVINSSNLSPSPPTPQNVNSGSRHSSASSSTNE
ncbi:BTB/POZ domain-containing protein 6 isoform X2 [Contarinia nasturtii]|uniref:BTB/POZ domain-containing protein 6 isoform X2 n=1 Tax=Contarinia nasturtii TaxID=265458 RepID=UPI0012D39FD2|nr:BTB/POZ domain-containing protein 6 isoform X2 [Contarinia nasturtii]